MKSWFTDHLKGENWLFFRDILTLWRIILCQNDLSLSCFSHQALSFVNTSLQFEAFRHSKHDKREDLISRTAKHFLLEFYLPEIFVLDLRQESFYSGTRNQYFFIPSFCVEDSRGKISLINHLLAKVSRGVFGGWEALLVIKKAFRGERGSFMINHLCPIINSFQNDRQSITLRGCGSNKSDNERIWISAVRNCFLLTFLTLETCSWIKF